MKKTVIVFFLLLLCALPSFSQHQELTLDVITPLTLYPALDGNAPEEAGAVQFEAVAVEYMVFFNDIFGIGLMLGGGMLSVEQVYPDEGGIVLPLSMSVQITVMENEDIAIPILARAGVLPAFRDFSSSGSVDFYFQGNVMAGIVLRHAGLRILVGAATIDFQIIGLRLEFGFTWRYEEMPF